ncbi:endospore germination permease [Bacillus sp. FJAT-47783]|uniref:GerAB/ArcD/ProY family transporter n=1 Tax=Bacillus sp. FJAT-47783 TaxID=2922712 RepID=UPI001FAB3EF7|nr:endospore germination permease [Bacillus sp. FJAT-47783]
MVSNENISTAHFFTYVFMFTIGSTILIIPSFLAESAKQDAWFAAIVGVGIGSILVFLFSSIGKRFENKSLYEINEEVFGKWIGKITTYYYSFYFLVLSALLVREVGDFLTQNVMRETPIQAIMMIFILVIVMGIKLGLSVLFNAAQLFLPIMLLLLFIFFAGLLPQIDINNLFPVLEEGIKPILKADYYFIGVPFLELIIFNIVYPFVDEQKNLRKVFLFAVLGGGGVLIVLTLLHILVLGGHLTAHFAHSSYYLAKKINVGNFLNRIEVVMAIIWFISLYFKAALCFYATNVGIMHLFNLKSYGSIVFPFGMILTIFSLVISPNSAYFHTFVAYSWTPYSLSIGLVLPLILLAVHTVKKKRNTEL